MRLPAAAVLRYVSWACLGRTDAKIQNISSKDNPRVQAWMTTAVSEFNFFHSKTDLVYRHEWLCRSGNGHGGSILTPQVENKNCQSVGTCSTWKMQSWLENTSVAFLCNVYRTAVTFSVQIICLKKNLNARRPLSLLEAACTVLFPWHVAAFEMHLLCGCVSPKRSKTMCYTTPRL